MSDNITEHDDGYYFWDDYDYLIGPFNTYDIAEKAYLESLKWQRREHKKGLKKFKETEL